MCDHFSLIRCKKFKYRQIGASELREPIPGLRIYPIFLINYLTKTMTHCFVVDRSLGTLAKWLRILGYDTICEPEGSGQDFYARLEDDRILITRSGKIKKMWGDHHHAFITSNRLVEQLKQVVGQIGIDRGDTRLFSRCIHCNLPIDEIDKNDAYGLVPDYIWETQDAFNQCPQCKRIYWSGSHAERSGEIINQIFDSREKNG